MKLDPQESAHRAVRRVQKRQQKRRQAGPFKRLLGTLIILVVLASTFGLGAYWFTTLLINAGMPAGVWPALLGAFLWYIVMWALIMWPARFSRRFHTHNNAAAPGPPHAPPPPPPPGQERHRGPGSVYTDLVDAVDRITVGDFDVLLETSEEDFGGRYWSELAEKINLMAKQLSGMEQMRQDFVSSVSHEIQSPLTSIQGFAGLLGKEDLPEEKRRHYLQVIQSEAERLSKLSDNLLRLTQLDDASAPFQPREYRLDKQLQEILLPFEPQWLAAGLTVELDAAELPICADKDLLEQVWINLLHNAIKFTPRGGLVSVRATQGGGVIRCEVSDSGPGIPAESLPHLFERFYKADPSRTKTGSGLGLSIAKKIVDIHGGAIYAQSEQGRGTTFCVTLPAKQPGCE